MTDLDQKFDGRDIREGYFSWVEHVLFYTFVPLIGPDAAWLYTTLARLIPEKDRNPLMKLNVRAMRDASGLAQGTVYRKLEVLTALGMVLEYRAPGAAKTSSPQLRLGTLRELNDLGRSELLRRLPVPPGNKSLIPEWQKLHPEYTVKASQTRVESEDEADDDVELPGDGLEAPARSAAQLVPPWNNSEVAPKVVTMPSKSEQPATELFQKAGVVVPETGGSCSKKPGELFQGSDPNLNKTKPDLSTPLTPVPGEPAGDGPALSFAECRYGDPQFEVNARDAAAWVLEAIGASVGAGSTRRLQREIALQLGMEAKRTRKELAELARTMAANWNVYQVEVEFAVGLAKFVSLGFWARPETWRRRAGSANPQASIGASKPQSAEEVQAGWLELRDRTAAYLEERARKVERLSIAPDVVKGLGSLATEFHLAESHAGIYAQAEQRLNELEDELVTACAALLTTAEIDTIRSGIEKKLQEYKARMKPEAYEKQVQGALDVAVLQEAGAPRLALFYMTQK